MAYVVFAVLVTVAVSWIIDKGTQKQMPLCYVVIMVALMAAFVVFLVGTNHAPETLEDKKKNGVSKGVAVSVVAVLLILLLAGTNICFGMVYGMDDTWGPRQQTLKGSVSYVIYYLCLAAFFAIVCWILHKETDAANDDKWSNIPIVCIGALMCLYSFGYCYQPDIFNVNWYSRHHITAVTHSIYNVAFNEPYSVASSSMYGHYAMFFRSFLLIFGHSPQLVMALLGGVAVVMEIVWQIVICRTVKSRGLRILGIMAMNVTMFYFGVYLQIMPLRWLFTGILLLYAVVEYQNKRLLTVRSRIIGILLSTLAILWQTDSGLTASFAYVVSLWIYGWEEEKPLSRKMIRIYIESLVGMAVSILLMLLTVGGYNILCGGSFDWKAFLYPLISNDGYTEALITAAGSGEQWLCALPILLFGLLTAVGLSGTKLMNIKCQESKTAWGMVGVFGFSQCYYFFNRPIAGPGIIVPYAVVGMCMIVECTVNLRKEGIKLPQFSASCLCGSGIVCLFVLSAMTAATTLQLGDMTDGSWHDVSVITELAGGIKIKVPENTYAVGYGTQEVYAVLGWDPQYHLRDQSDFWRGSVPSATREAINSQNSVLVSEGLMEGLKLADTDEWELKEEFKTEEITLQYWTRK